ncbi:STAS domain-containing protein [Lentzea sp. NPDC034063]|uniref:STAS domain-containing protein n=1 Tax=unclassified Lentzea TaxID=2643253 RepID=UPI0033DE143B
MGERGENTHLAQAETIVHDGVALVRLTGEIDMINAQHTRSVLQSQLDARPEILIVDLALDFLGSAGLATLFEAHTRAEQDDVGFAVVAAEHVPRHALEVSGLDHAFAVFDTVADAFEALRSSD